MKTIDVTAMVKSQLEAMKADGLCAPDLECGCGLNDLAPCGELGQGCVAAVRRLVDCGEPTPYWLYCPMDAAQSDEEPE